MGVSLKSFPLSRWDLVFLIGCAVFVYGLSLAWRPLGFIVGGLIVASGAFFKGYWASRRRV